MKKSEQKERCPWCGADPVYMRYHDEEWGCPVHDEARHFEFLLLETQQAGLSWLTVLKKREAYRRVFAGFDPCRVARFGEDDVVRLLADPGIIRNRRKIEAAIKNAQRFLAIQERFGSFDTWLWHFTEGRTVINHWTSIGELPTSSELSDLVSKELKEAGFSFVGTTTIYAHLQAVGVINDHLVSCFRWKELACDTL
ncbi:MAG TPA: DNA-3-methyladenine glycosylase I [Spirochaetales bacterium]|nr:DNA-3-methyladenine glycosylase I [Spirochaetales bacterium]HOV94540.1 DNA-3-methyladenine glycosylase I [Spirochaetales bacterium]HPS15288.1 DNA-3-methyladenine glycosylase I [Spirochaetales bacterium]